MIDDVQDNMPELEILLKIMTKRVRSFLLIPGTKALRILMHIFIVLNGLPLLNGLLGCGHVHSLAQEVVI
jgi:hypothetical protein